MKIHAPAAMRNRAPILEVLRRVLPPSGLVLEVASGSGEHAIFFAAALPALQWQPSDAGADARASIQAYRTADRDVGGATNLLAPIALDAAAPTWRVSHADAIVCINMIHIAPWAACEGLFAGAARVLPAGAPLVLYGPFRFSGAFTAPSNETFDAGLRERDAAWGVRDVDDLTALGTKAGLERREILPMPANNHVIWFAKS